jgi:hypothetical protein
MKLSVSDLLRYNSCAYSHHCAQTAGVPAPSGAMRRGTALHHALEQRLSGPGIPEIDYSTVDEDDHAFVQKGVARLMEWEPPGIVETDDAELALSMDTGAYTIVGRLDALMRCPDGYWSLQLKTLGKGVNPALAMEKVRMSPHEITYAWLAKHTRDIDIKGTYLILLRDLTIKAAKEGTDMMTTIFLPRSSGEVSHAMAQDILPLFDDMVNPLRVHGHDWTSCYGQFGNSPCPYFEHCHNGLPLDAGLLNLTKLEDRYEGV